MSPAGKAGIGLPLGPRPRHPLPSARRTFATPSSSSSSLMRTTGRVYPIASTFSSTTTGPRSRAYQHSGHPTRSVSASGVGARGGGGKSLSVGATGGGRYRTTPSYHRVHPPSRYGLSRIGARARARSRDSIRDSDSDTEDEDEDDLPSSRRPSHITTDRALPSHRYLTAHTSRILGDQRKGTSKPQHPQLQHPPSRKGMCACVLVYASMHLPTQSISHNAGGGGDT